MGADLELAVAADRVAEALQDTLGVVREHLRRALTTAGRDMSSLARALAPHGATGKLERSLSRVLLTETATRLTERVGPAAYWGTMLEKGVKARLLTVKLASGTTYTRRQVIAARPFLGPTMDAVRDQVRRDVLAALDKGAEAFNNG